MDRSMITLVTTIFLFVAYGIYRTTDTLALQVIAWMLLIWGAYGYYIRKF